MKGFDLENMEYIGCTAHEVDEIAVCEIGNEFTGGIGVYFVKMTISGEEYIIAESVTTEVFFANELADIIAMHTKIKIMQDGS